MNEIQCSSTSISADKVEILDAQARILRQQIEIRELKKKLAVANSKPKLTEFKGSIRELERLHELGYI